MKSFLTPRYLLYLIIFLPVIAFTQNDNYYTKIQNTKIRGEQYWDSFKLYEETLENAEGSPYANPEFLPGRLFKGNEAVTNILFLRYNAMSDEIEVKPTENATTISIITKDPEVFAKIGLDMYLYVESTNPNEDNGFFKILKDLPKYDLVKKMKVTFIDAKFAKTSYDKSSRAKFVQEVSFYLTDDNGNFYKLPNSRAKILKVMSKKKNEIKDFMRRGKIDVSKEEDLTRLVTYFNSLL